MSITEALEVPVLIVDGQGTGRQNAQASKTISCTALHIIFRLTKQDFECFTQPVQ